MSFLEVLNHSLGILKMSFIFPMNFSIFVNLQRLSAVYNFLLETKQKIKR